MKRTFVWINLNDKEIKRYKFHIKRTKENPQLEKRKQNYFLANKKNYV